MISTSPRPKPEIFVLVSVDSIAKTNEVRSKRFTIPKVLTNTGSPNKSCFFGLEIPISPARSVDTEANKTKQTQQEVLRICIDSYQLMLSFRIDELSRQNSANGVLRPIEEDSQNGFEFGGVAGSIEHVVCDRAAKPVGFGSLLGSRRKDSVGEVCLCEINFHEPTRVVVQSADADSVSVLPGAVALIGIPVLQFLKCSHGSGEDERLQSVSSRDKPTVSRRLVDANSKMVSKFADLRFLTFEIWGEPGPVRT